MVANVVAIFATLLSVPIPLLMPLLIDEVVLQQPAAGIALLDSFVPQPWQTPVGYVVIVTLLVVVMRLASQALNIYQTRQFTLISKSLTGMVREQLLTKLGNISMRQYEELGSGSLTAHFVTDVETIDQFIGGALSRFLIAVLSTLGIAAVLFWLDWKLALFIVLLNPVIVYFSRLMGQRVKTLKKRENRSFERFQQRLVETLEGLYQLRASSREQLYLTKLKEDSNNIRIDADSYAWQSDAANRVSFLMFLVGFEIFRAVAVVLVLMGDLSVGQIFAIFGYLWFMLSPIQDLLSIQYSWFSASAAMKRINTLLALEDEKRPVSIVNPFKDNESFEIECRNVCFSFDGERTVLDNLNLTIKKGQCVALVGASGGGKSTLIQLLLGIYQKESGDILINGHPIESVGYEALRKRIAPVLQQPIIFNDTVRQNLTLGEQHTDDELYAALSVAQLTEAINSMPEGLDSQLGRQGVRLSGGQRQRLAIARMVLTNPDFVILDEATSALDTATESSLHQAMKSFLVGKTTLIVAHRLSAVKQADVIYVLEDGKVIQSGQHQQLVMENGLYQTLYG
ncbi:ABC transporter ATP-binding protein [Vibrio genomosp. F10 str. 9ZC157]|uniref:ABC transporter ATP-binding protein n=1 Tax=Vibrio genomosp. F10 str. ZF-129 TaxID=1187848 RepID=A0A1E5B9Y0_9VIBR|nr:ABC transporter ATP-binding protein [Vibrio genomosp. F10]OEE30719.1 ABC transporter ATP-binding protein [Vibrio genomosp. F10 str. ZF-129]OEE94024.1 ABC transporter ATP-binding protein [Vibrio genomosp. F10 str. 9ZC157]